MYLLIFSYIYEIIDFFYGNESCKGHSSTICYSDCTCGPQILKSIIVQRLRVTIGLLALVFSLTTAYYKEQLYDVV